MNPWHSTRFLNVLANLLFGFALVVLLVGALGWIVNRPFFSIHEIEVGPAPGHALRHVPQQILNNAVRDSVAGSFFTMDMTAIRAGIEKVPWVRLATVRRIWPDKLVLLLEEHRPFALWQDGQLINTYGELFSANLDEAEADGPLPQLGGPAGTELEVARRYAQIRDLVEPLRLHPTAISLSARRAWTARLNDGTDLIIGRDQGVPVADRIERWVQSYPLVTERMQRRASVIDLRYPNGFTVRSLEKLADAFDIDDLIAEANARDSSKSSTPTTAGLKKQAGSGSQ